MQFHQRFEYNVITGYSTQGVMESLDKAGQDGWFIAGVMGDKLIMSRPISEIKPPAAPKTSKTETVHIVTVTVPDKSCSLRVAAVFENLKEAEAYCNEKQERYPNNTYLIDPWHVR